jgi:ABC-type transporter Mla maintaining outer membrane lipid asymmetry ATPase subunit MlaF
MILCVCWLLNLLLLRANEAAQISHGIISWNVTALTTNSKRTAILKSVSGKIAVGKLHGIMGPSGTES